MVIFGEGNLLPKVSPVLPAKCTDFVLAGSTARRRIDHAIT